MPETRDFVVGVLIGSVLGAATALLMAPASGTETRRLLKDKAGEAKDRTGDLVQQAQSRVGDLTSQAQNRIGDLTSQARSRVGEVSNQVTGAIDRQRGAVTAAVEAGRQAYAQKATQLQSEVAEDTLPATPALGASSGDTPSTTDGTSTHGLASDGGSITGGATGATGSGDTPGTEPTI